MISICPRCQLRFSHSKYEVDFIHQCDSGESALDEIDRPHLDQDAWNFAGLANRLQGTRAGIEGSDDESRTDRGLRASTRTQVAHFEYIDLRGKK